MDEYQLVAVIAVSAAVGFIAATVKHGREMRSFHRFHATTHINSLTQLVGAALKTLIEDFKIPEQEAKDKLFANAEQVGMKLVRIDPATGEKTDLGSKQS